MWKYGIEREKRLTELKKERNKILNRELPKKIFLYFLQMNTKPTYIARDIYCSTKTKGGQVNDYVKVMKELGYLQEIEGKPICYYKKKKWRYSDKEGKSIIATINPFLEDYPQFTQKDKQILSLFFAHPSIRSKVVQEATKVPIDIAFSNVLHSYLLDFFTCDQIKIYNKTPKKNRENAKPQNKYCSILKKEAIGTDYDFTKLYFNLRELDNNVLPKINPDLCSVKEALHYRCITKIFERKEIVDLLFRAFPDNKVMLHILLKEGKHYKNTPKHPKSKVK